MKKDQKKLHLKMEQKKNLMLLFFVQDIILQFQW